MSSESSIYYEYYKNKIFGKSNNRKTNDCIAEVLLRNNKRENLTNEQIVEQENFIHIVCEMYNKYPLIYLPNFIQEFVEGEWSKNLVKKYDINDMNELQYVQNNILKLIGKRQKKSEKTHAFETNLQSKQWSDQYKFLINHCKLFQDSLEHLYNRTLLRAFIIIVLLENDLPLSMTEVIRGMTIKTDDFWYLFPNNDVTIKKQFEKYLINSYKSDIENVFQELENDNFLDVNHLTNNIKLRITSNELTERILEIISKHHDGMMYYRLYKLLLEQIPLLRLFPTNEYFMAIIKLLEDTQKIVVQPAFYRPSRPYQDILFLKQNYEKKNSELDNQTKLAENKFFGRKITPDQFIEEIIQLEKGDIGDVDDQVTRLAGLVLAESTNLLASNEKIEEFDFAIDISNYNFKPEQIEAMKEINFVITSKIIHNKVMINESLTTTTLEKIIRAIPSGHQAVIYTFTDIPHSLQKLLPQNNSIQIIGETALRLWTSITKVLPCRKGSISKIIVGDLLGNLARVILINYESGLALVSLIPTMMEKTIPIGWLEEIPLYESSVAEFVRLSNNYQEFLKLLYHCSPDNFIEGIKMQNLTIDKIYNETQSSLQPYHYVWKVSSEHVDVLIPTSGWEYLHDDLKCNCMHRVNQEHSYTLCKHMVAALNLICIKGYYHNDWNSSRNSLRLRMEQFLEKSVESTVKKFLYDLSDDSIKLKNYLDSYYHLNDLST